MAVEVPAGPPPSLLPKEMEEDTAEEGAPWIIPCEKEGCVSR